MGASFACFVLGVAAYTAGTLAHRRLPSSLGRKQTIRICNGAPYPISMHIRDKRCLVEPGASWDFEDHVEDGVMEDTWRMVDIWRVGGNIIAARHVHTDSKYAFCERTDGTVELQFQGFV